MTALVTGGAGFIRSNLVRRLQEEGDEVRLHDSYFSTGSSSNLEGLDVELVEGDLRSYERVASAARGADVIFHQGPAFGAAVNPGPSNDQRGEY